MSLTTTLLIILVVLFLGVVDSTVGDGVRWKR